MNIHVPSLLDMAGIKILASICKETNVYHDDATINLFLRHDKDRTHTHFTLIDGIETLNLPSPIRKRLTSFIHPMTEQIASWLRCVARVLKSTHIPCRFFWTSQGTLDHRGTAMDLLRNEEINVTDRFGLACFYCLETEICSLWDRIEEPKSQKLDERLKLDNGMIRFWILQKDPNHPLLFDIRPKPFDIPSTTLMEMMRQSVLYKNCLPVEYFWSKFTTGDKIYFSSEYLQMFLEYAHIPCYGTLQNIFHFMFSTMDKGNLSAELEKYCYKILCVFLYWPWPDRFIAYVGLSWNFLSPEEFQNLLIKIMCQNEDYFGQNLIIKNTCPSEDHFGELFEWFWLQSPIPLQRFMVNSDFTHLFSCLDDADGDKISLFLKHTSVEEKNNIIFSDYGMKTCSYFYDRKKWLLFRRFLSECLTTAELVVKFCDKILRNLGINKNKLLKEADVIIFSLLKKRSQEGKACREK